MFTILSIIGTRPEAIKMAPVVKELAKHSDRLRSLVCVSGQHRHMLDQVLKLFEINPDFDLNIKEPDQRLSQLSATLFTTLDHVLQQVKPDCLLAQGDTTTVLVASLAAYYHGSRFGHVEAGLRTGDRYRPFPTIGLPLIGAFDEAIDSHSDGFGWYTGRGSWIGGSSAGDA